MWLELAKGMNYLLMLFSIVGFIAMTGSLMHDHREKKRVERIREKYRQIYAEREVR